MTTTKRLWLGFGLLLVLLTVSVGSIVALLIIIRQQVHEMATVSRPRSAAAREIEINVLEFAVGVHHYLDAGDSAIWLRAQEDAGDVDRAVTEYGRLAATASHGEMAARLATRWREFRVAGHALVERDHRRPDAAALARFADRRLELEQFLDDVVQADAVAAFEADRETAEQTISASIGVGVVLLILGLVVALGTSWRVTQGIARVEAAVWSERNRLQSIFQTMPDGVALFDLAGNLVELNQALATINGYASPEEMKQNLSHFAATYELSDFNGTPVPVEQWPVSLVLRGETVHSLELRARRRDTGQKWSFSFSGVPVKNELGQQVQALVVTHDTTARMRMELQLR